MDATRVMKRKGLLLGLLAIMIVIGVAVAFYFIGFHGNDCVQVPPSPPTSKDISSVPSPGHKGRLPRHIEPVLYNIEIFPDIYGTDPLKFSFIGRMRLQFRCLEGSANITMNINQLNIKEMKIFHIDQNNISSVQEIESHVVDEKWQFLIIHVKQPLKKGNNYSIEISYIGRLKEDNAGLYLSKMSQNSGLQYVAATQFSPTDARKAFPCFDEPDRKAQFDITLVRRSDIITLSNMPITRTEHHNNEFVVDVYQRTPKMSTYLIAMVFGDFSSLTIQAREGLNYTSWAWEGNVNRTATGLRFGANVLAVFESYFENAFPLPKQDMLAVPETAVGAMENWGLIIFREERIIFDPEKDSAELRVSATRTISHELAHQWFGNLVTQRWWSDLFLKEGFAVYFAECGMDKVHPEWNIMEQFGVEIMHPVFETDGLESSHPVHMELSDTTQIRQVFDSISYAKGGCMIRLLNFILGDADFQVGMKNYLGNLKYNNVDHNGLWSAVETYPPSSPSVHDVMNSWILQKNYPVVTVSQVKPGLLHIHQERYLNTPVAVNTTIEPMIWKIPFTFTTSRESNFSVDHTRIIWLEHSDMVIVDREFQDMHENGNWVIGNVQQMGYYRVNYSPLIWNNIIKQLTVNNLAIHLVNRAQLINDLFAMSKAGRVQIKLALSILNYLYGEHEYVPWRAALNERSFMDNLVKQTGIYAKFKNAWSYLVNNTLSVLQEDIALGNVSLSRRRLHAELFSVGVSYGIQRCIDKANLDFNNFKKNSSKLDADTRDASLCSVMKNVSVADWEWLLTLYNLTVDVGEKNTYLYALTCTENSSLQTRLITLTEDTSTFKGSISVTALTSLAENPKALEKVWNYITSHWNYFLEKFAGSLFQLARLVSGVTKEFTSSKQLNDLETFVNKTSDLGPARQSFLQAIEKTKAKVEWIEKNLVSLEEWIDSTIRTYVK